jgi:hypothetical protein
MNEADKVTEAAVTVRRQSNHQKGSLSWPATK